MRPGRVIKVAKEGGDAPTVSAAVASAVSGDVVLIAPGRYAPSSGERFPIYVPPGVDLLGAGAGKTLINGEGQLDWSWRPFRGDQSLLVLRGRSTVSGLTICGSGGCGVAALPGAEVVITENDIRDNGFHGLFLHGVADAVVRKNFFLGNGKRAVEIPIYRPQPARPGESIFIVCGVSAPTRALIEGNDIAGSSGQESLTVIADADDSGAQGEVRLFDNRFDVARVAVLLCASFGGSRGRLAVEARQNEVRGAGCALIACGAYPVVRQEACDNALTLSLSSNTIRDSQLGVQLIGGFSPTRRNTVSAELVGNTFVDIAGAEVRAMGAVGGAQAPALENQVRARLLRNTFDGTSPHPVVVDGAALEVPNGVLSRDNEARVSLEANRIRRRPGALVLTRQGPSGNRASVEGSGSETSTALPSWRE